MCVCVCVCVCVYTYIYTMIKWDLFQICKTSSTGKNQCNRIQKKNHIIVLSDTKKALNI